MICKTRFFGTRKHTKEMKTVLLNDIRVYAVWFSS